MSTIFGIVHFDGTIPDRRAIDRMGATLGHYARDGMGIDQAGPAALGICVNRLRTIDRLDVQPLEHGAVMLVASARLDNRETLAAALAIEDLSATPDSALILAAYHKWGEACPAHLLGDFVFALWDGNARRLMLARDHMGQRDLIYHIGEGFVAFAPQTNTLWTLPHVPRLLTDEKIGKRLIHDRRANGGETMFEGIRSLPGGTMLIAAPDAAGKLAVQVTSYWEPAADPKHLGQDEDYYVRAYAEVLGEAVACRLRDLIDPPGLHLSGGYDSGAIAGLAGRSLPPGGKLIAATSVMPQDYGGTIRHAGRWIDLCERDMPWLDLHRITREGRDALTNMDRNLAERGNHSSYSFVHDALDEALSGAGVRLVMDGHGGDYTLNPRGQAALARLWRTRQWRSFFRELRAHRRMTGRSWRTTINLDLLQHIAPNLLPSTWVKRWRGRLPWADQPIQAGFARQLIANGVVDPNRLRAAPRDQTQMRNNLKDTIDRVRDGGGGGSAAYYGMVKSRPFHDKRVVELALAIPEDLYLKHGRNRYLACKALADVYPPEYQHRWRRNDDEIPDFQAMICRIKPQLLADIARMEQSEKLSAMIDFGKIRALLDARGPDDHNSGWEEESQVALGGYMTARFVEWFRRDNN